jgi:hypothetical protein
MTNRPNYHNSIRWNQPYSMSITGASGWRKRKIIENTLNELHSQQLDMIDQALEKSDLREAKEVIDYIKNKA